MQLIDGKATAAEIKKEIAAEVSRMVAEGRRRPHLAAILVGNDGGSEAYVASKVRACEECGFQSTLLRFDTDVTEDELLAAVNTGSKKERGALWYNVGRFVYVPLAVILCCVALFLKIAF